uniref:P53-induced death domain protein 1 n=1 Tax=Erpetoichthys calabaricus TaxID=27687 RepID=A0A8C4RX11_ERPCA
MHSPNRNCLFTGKLTSLHRLHLHSNHLVKVPACLAGLPNLTHLDLQNNNLHSVPYEIETFLYSYLKGNPIGQTESTFHESQVLDPEVLLLFCSRDLSARNFLVTEDGGKVRLHAGMELDFPMGAATKLTVRWRVFYPSRNWVKLAHHDLLLSEILELQPHGTLFNDVSFSMPFLHPYSKSHRDVVIRTFDGSSWSDLETCILVLSFLQFYLARCCVSHFSWFMVVSRLVEDHCTVPREGTLLFSSADPRIKVTFPCGATNVIRKVNMQVLTVSQQEIQNLCGDAEALASPLLCLTQNSPDNFLQPVRIQLPLPSSLKGFSLDHSRIHLFHGDPTAETWTDITQQVQLQFTHLFVIFEVTHFSCWCSQAYWLWYTTKHYIGGVVRNVYKRLRLYQVRFLALQRKKDPEQILLQCLPNQKVALRHRYDGPEPSEIISMLEGEQFFAGFEKGIEVDSDRPDCVDGRICFVFYSQLKNMKEVSFYRGALPDSFPEEALKRRKGPDSQWLATLPICLPSLLSPSNKDPLYPSLNLGNAENGYLTEANLLGIALRIGTDWRNIGINLGLSYQHLDRIQYKNRDDLGNQALEMLFTWAQNNVNSPDCINKLIEAMKDSGRKDIADEIEDIITLGKQKYFQSINRLGLEPAGSSQEDSAISMI